MKFADNSYWVDVELPDKLSDLIEKAISDYNGLDREKYYPVSEQWHDTYYPSEGFSDMPGRPHCGVCLAGAVIAGSFGAFWELRYSPGAFGDLKVQNKLLALESVRLGKIGEALFGMGVHESQFSGAQSDLVRSIEADVDLGEWDKLKCWSGWDELMDVKAHLIGVAARLRAVGL